MGNIYCNDAGTVPVALLVRAVNVALGIAECPDDPGAPNENFEDTGLTVIDHLTGLEWEKKTGVVGIGATCPGGASCGDPHNVNNLYTWSNGGIEFDGSARTLFLDALNDVAGGGADCFAGHCDWRLPSSDGSPEHPTGEAAELESIVDCGSRPPCIDPIFGPSVSGYYWSSSTDTVANWTAWIVSFENGSAPITGKPDSHYARAVRGGSD